MRKLCVFLVVSMLALGSFGQTLGDTASPVTQYGFTLATNIVNGSWSWTNDCVYPWRFSSLMVRLPVTTTNTLTITRVRDVVVDYQYRGNVTETNFTGLVITNWSSDITNKVFTTVTNAVFTQTVTNDTDTYWTIGPNSDDLPEGAYELLGDRFTFSVTPTSSTAIAFDTIR